MVSPDCCPKPPYAASTAVERRRTGRLHPQGRSEAEGGVSQASCLARNARERRGRRLADAVAGKGRDGARPAPREAAGAWQHRQRTTLATASHSRDRRCLPVLIITQKPRSEPVPDPRQARINLTSGRRRYGCTIIPPTAARAQEDETILDDGVSAMPRCGRPPGFRRADQARTELLLGCQARMAAPSITTPALTYFHRATTSFRANAVIITFFRRPPF